MPTMPEIIIIGLLVAIAYLLRQLRTVQASSDLKEINEAVYGCYQLLWDIRKAADVSASAVHYDHKTRNRPMHRGLIMREDNDQ